MDLNSDNNFASLTSSQWEELCYSLLLAEGEHVVKTDGSGGDEGIDAIEGEVKNPRTIYQFKHFPKGLGARQVTQIERSLNKAMKHGDGFKWVLMCSADPTTAALKKLDRLKEDTPNVDIRFCFGSEIRGKLLVRRSVRQQFYKSEEDLFFEGIESEGKADFPQSFSRKARLLNQRIEDDRFRARVSSDGGITEVQYALQPWVTEPVPLLNLTAKSSSAAEAFKGLLEKGIDFSLSGNDVEVKELVNLLPRDPDETLDRIWTMSLPANDGCLLRLFSGKDEHSTTVVVNLETERRGTKEWVRSNVAQKECPLTFSATFHSLTGDGKGKWGASCEVTGRLYGIRLSAALRGAKFMAEVSKSGLMGLGGIDSPASEANFAPIGHALDMTFLENRLCYLEELKDAFDLFGVDPVLSDDLEDEGVAKAIGFIQRTIGWANEGETEGEISFDIVPGGIYKTAVATSEADGSEAFRTNYVLEAFGYRMVATIYMTVRNPTVRTETLEGGSTRYIVRGFHTIRIEDVVAKPL